MALLSSDIVYSDVFAHYIQVQPIKPSWVDKFDYVIDMFTSLQHYVIAFPDFDDDGWFVTVCHSEPDFESPDNVNNDVRVKHTWCHLDLNNPIGGDIIQDDDGIVLSQRSLIRVQDSDVRLVNVIRSVRDFSQFVQTITHPSRIFERQIGECISVTMYRKFLIRYQRPMSPLEGFILLDPFFQKYLYDLIFSITNSKSSPTEVVPGNKIGRTRFGATEADLFILKTKSSKTTKYVKIKARVGAKTFMVEFRVGSTVSGTLCEPDSLNDIRSLVLENVWLRGGETPYIYQ